jgi:hypothetical protein
MNKTAHDIAHQGRLLAAFLVLAGALGAASAQTDSTPLTPAQSLSCLQRPAAALEFPQRHRYDRGAGYLRVRLQFERPDAEPKVEVLANTAREDMQDRVFRYLSSYRLPCLQPQDGVVAAVQEFNFTNTDVQPLPLPDTMRRHSFCLVMPREDMRPVKMDGREVQHVALVALFSGDGSQETEVKVLHSTAKPHLEEEAVERLKRYRMPCRTGTEGIQAMRQNFAFVPTGYRRYVLARQALPLVEFLGMTQGAQQLKASFDFNTMSCPFNVNYTIYGPALPNEVTAGGKRDPNRVLFLKWLQERQLKFDSDKQANELFGQTLQIQIPCGGLQLDPEPSSVAGS